MGGGLNHRFGQTDVWMIKDNHKACLGGLKGALEFFKSQGAFYNNVVAEIHDLNELEEAFALGIKHVMLDNFSPQRAEKTIAYLKKAGLRKKILIEISGGVNLSNIKEYAHALPDMISVGSLTHSSKSIDFSMEMENN